jgi:SAM-dependent methyltransferase
MSDSKTVRDAELVRQTVRDGYSQIAQHGSERRSGGKSCCCSPLPETEKLAQYIGYSAEELAALPEGANMGLSCGNPNALAALRPGEVVLDLGSGGGFDVFIAGRKVGPTGRAIGADMTPDMIAKARKLGVSLDDMAAAVNTAQSVKQAPAQAILKLADRFLNGDFSTTPETDGCPGLAENTKSPGRCCP